MILTTTKAAEISKCVIAIGKLSQERQTALDRGNYPMAKKMQRKINFQRGRIEELETGKTNEFADE